ncbi:MAG: hypothetical protein KC462_04110, partial [Cyanobacteria bacterium HKST-UBA05]|nr:hypothetical protein [Cyanobacteria bacterium HKST-UBA05]
YALLNQRLTNNLATAKYYELGSFVQGARDHVNTAVSVNTWQFDQDGNQTIDTADGVALSALESTKKSEARDVQTARQQHATYIDLNTEAAGLQADVDAAGGADIVVDDEAKAAKDINADGVINQADVDLTRDREAQIRQDALDAHDAHIAAATAQELTDEAAAVAQHINDNGEGLATNDTLAMDVNADGHIDQADVDKLTDAANDGRP